MATTKQIAEQMAAVVKKETGAVVEFTVVNEKAFTLYGLTADVEKAIGFMSQGEGNGWKFQNVEHGTDDLAGESCALYSF